MNKRLFVITLAFATLALIMLNCCSRILFVPVVKAEQVKDDLIVEMISKINQTEIYDTVYALQNFTTRRYGTSGNVAAATYLYDRLSNIPGLEVEYQGNYNHVIATLPGVDTNSDATYIVGAHYDSTSSNQNYAPGAIDNGGGVAIVLEFARVMSQYRFNQTLKFALWNKEETGDVVSKGSMDYVKWASINHLNISLYLNYDSSCYDPNNRFVLDIMYNSKSQWVSKMLTEYNTLYNIDLNLTYNIHSCTSDHSPFWAYGYTAVMTHAELHGPEHTSEDTIDKVSTAYAQKNGQLGMSVLATLAGVLQENTSPAPSPTPNQAASPTPTQTPSPTSIPTPSPASSSMPTETPSQPTSKPIDSPKLLGEQDLLFYVGIIALLFTIISVAALFFWKKRRAL